MAKQHVYRDRQRGSLLGVAVGNALDTAVEFEVRARTRR
jgi:ADP-ribosylglycohydrolase